MCEAKKVWSSFSHYLDGGEGAMMEREGRREEKDWAFFFETALSFFFSLFFCFLMFLFWGE